MTEQTKAVFENPQLLRQKLGEFLGTDDSIKIEKFAVTAQKCFAKGGKVSLRFSISWSWWPFFLGILSLFLGVLPLIWRKNYLQAFFWWILYFITIGFSVFILPCFYKYLIIKRFEKALDGGDEKFSKMSGTNLLAVFIVLFLPLILGFIVVTIPRFASTRADAEISATIANIRTLLADAGTYSAIKGNFHGVKYRDFTNIRVSNIDAVALNNEVFITVDGSDCVGIKLEEQNGNYSFKFYPSSNANDTCKEVLNNPTIKTYLEGDIKINHSEIINGIEIGGEEYRQDTELSQNQVSSAEKEEQNFSELCEKNNAEACYKLGSSYEMNDKIRALSLKQKSCELEWAQGCFEVGEFYNDNGDSENTLKYYKKACDSNNAPACRALFWLYKEGKYVEKNEIEAITLLNKAIRLYEPSCYKEGGFKICQYLAEQYEDRKDWESAIKFYDLACNGGLPVACKIIAEKYEKGLAIQQNLDQAKEYYGKYCDLGFEDGCKEFKRLNNTDSNKPVDQNELANQCNKNNALSCRNLGLMYESGIFNAGSKKQTQTQALKIFNKACNLGDAKSCEHAWRMYSKINVRCEPECVYTPNDDEIINKYMDRACELDINFCTAE